MRGDILLSVEILAGNLGGIKMLVGCGEQMFGSLSAEAKMNHSVLVSGLIRCVVFRQSLYTFHTDNFLPKGHWNETTCNIIICVFACADHKRNK